MNDPIKPRERIAKLPPISENVNARAIRLLLAWQRAANLNDSQPQLRDALNRADADSARVLAEVILRARMQDALSNALCGAAPHVDHDQAVENEIRALGFSAAVISRAYALCDSVAGARGHTVEAVDATAAWYSAP